MVYPQLKYWYLRLIIQIGKGGVSDMDQKSQNTIFTKIGYLINNKFLSHQGMNQTRNLTPRQIKQ